MSVTISGSGQIIKQVQSTFVSTSIALSVGSTYTWYDIPGISVSITPTNASNKILIVASLNNCPNALTLNFQITRNGTAVGTATEAGFTWQSNAMSYFNGSSGYSVTPTSIVYLDSPATTSPITYKIQGGGDGTGTTYLNRRAADNRFVCTSTITVYEVAYA